METIFNIIETKGLWATILVLLGLLMWETASPFFKLFTRGWRDRALHGFRNLCLGLINSLMISLLFIAMWLWAAELAEAKQFGLLYWTSLPSWAQALAAVLMLDLWTYWFHRLNHTLPFLWRFHRVHHSDEEMDVTTASRFHVGEIFISSALRVAVILLGGIQLWHVALYELIMFPIVQFHHANIGLPLRVDRWLRVLIVTPSMHKVHHSNVQPETDSNYTSLFSVWDRLFGSFRLREDETSIQFGLGNNVRPRRIADLIAEPFRKR